MEYLDYLENKSIYVIRESYARFKNMALLWSMGKDSTTLLHLCMKAFMGKIPFPVIHIDTGFKFPEMYEFRDRTARRLGLDLIVAENRLAKYRGMGPNKAGASKLECCNALKTESLQQIVAKLKIQSLLVGIRRDEHGIRAKERYFSARDESFKWNYTDQTAEPWDYYRSLERDGTHFRVHPILHMTEADIWRYISREKLEVIDLYFAKGGKRYRSIGCAPCCEPVESSASTIYEIILEIESSKTAERAGRAQDKEDAYTMQKLRSLGYM